MTHFLALVRPVSPELEAGERTFVGRAPIDPGLAIEQHAGYVAALTELGAEIQLLPPLDHLPDAVFVEDTAVILDECAIVCRSGALSRRAESPSVAAALEPLRPLHIMSEGDGTLEGGDVLRIGRELFVGRSSRSNDAGIAFLTEIAKGLGYRVVPVEVSGCLHLKTGAGWTGAAVVLNETWVDPTPFSHLPRLPLPEIEPFGANVLPLGNSLLVAASTPRTRALLAERGHAVVEVDISELEKAEAGLTCLSLLFPLHTAGNHDRNH